MNAVTVAEMRSIEESAIAAGWTEDQLMELAGDQLARSFSRFFPSPGTVVAYIGKGHNAGDAFVALRHLRDRCGWEIAIRPAYPAEKWAPLTRVKSHDLGKTTGYSEAPPCHNLKRPLVLLDGLLGIGASGPLRDPLGRLAAEMNDLRQSAGAKTAAIDLPSGTDPDTGEIHPGSVIADITFMIGAPKAGLLHEHAADATGALAVVPVEPLVRKQASLLAMITPESIGAVQQPRAFNFHKGLAGRVGILAGSRAYSGAAVLAATGALRAGGGLVTLHVPPDAMDLISAKCPPEVMVRACEDPRELLDLRYDSLVIGCGLDVTDEAYGGKVLELISRTELPTVLDAEALNLLPVPARPMLLKPNHVLTPHPGEFDRLTPRRNKDIVREKIICGFTSCTHTTLLLKGSRTAVTGYGMQVWLNPTGTPGMATGGQGDTLSGVIGALLAIGNPPLEAAAMGAWLCGRAAERALLDLRLSPESLLPSDVLANLGGAFRDWAERAR